MKNDLPIVNLETAKYECTFGRGCEGVCCKEGRPIIYADEVERLDANLVEKILPLMRPEARERVKKHGYLSGQTRFSLPTLRRSAGWCVFFNQGCVLHTLGEAEGDVFRYKPAVCALFPIQQDKHDNWYVRQHGFKGEKWDLFCLNPLQSPVPAGESLRAEIALAQRFDDAARAAVAEADVPVEVGLTEDSEPVA